MQVASAAALAYIETARAQKAVATAKANLDRACAALRPAPTVGAFAKLDAPAGLPGSSVLAWAGIAFVEVLFILGPTSPADHSDR